MKVLSVRKGGFDPNEFSQAVLCLQPDGTWREATPEDVPSLPAYFFHGYNCGHYEPKDDALDSIRSIESIWRQELLRFEPVCCLWPGLGETKLEALLFHQAIRNARRSAAIYAEFFNRVYLEKMKMFGMQGGFPFLLFGHSLGCALTGWLSAGLNRPADLVTWMGAAVPQYATCTLDPRLQGHDRVARLTAMIQRGKASDYLFDFAPGLARTKLVNVFGDDPLLGRAFHALIGERSCGRYGAWPGPERLPNITDIDVTDAVHQHGHYRHYMPMWRQLREIVRSV